MILIDFHSLCKIAHLVELSLTWYVKISLTFPGSVYYTEECIKE